MFLVATEELQESQRAREAMAAQVSELREDLARDEEIFSHKQVRAPRALVKHPLSIVRPQSNLVTRSGLKHPRQAPS